MVFEMANLEGNKITVLEIHEEKNPFIILVTVNAETRNMILFNLYYFHHFGRCRSW